MGSRLLRPLVQRRPERLTRISRPFPIDPPERHRVEEIGRSFLRGYNAMAAARDPAEVHQSVARLPRILRPFGYEGAAMGFGPWALRHRRGYRDFEEILGALSPGTRYQNYVGLGWWLGIWYRRRPARLAEIVAGLDHRYRLLPYEGIGFQRGFRAAGDPAVTRLFGSFGPVAAHVAYQGYGRSLWFVFMGDPGRALAVIDQLDRRYRGDCVSGLGLGIGFSWLDQLAALPGILDRVPAALQADLRQGVAFGWEARRLADPGLLARYTAAAPAPLRLAVGAGLRAVQLVRGRLERTAAGCPDFYQRWRHGVRSSLDHPDGWPVGGTLADHLPDLCPAAGASKSPSQRMEGHR